VSDQGFEAHPPSSHCKNNNTSLENGCDEIYVTMRSRPEINVKFIIETQSSCLAYNLRAY